MQQTNELFFIVISVIMWGLAIGGKSFIQFKKIFYSSEYWYLGLLCTASSFTLFSIASSVNLGLLILANTFLLAGYIFVAAYYRSQRTPLTFQFKLSILLTIFFIGVVMVCLMQWGSFINRVSFVSTLGIIFFIWQITELQINRRQNIPFSIFLDITIVLELLLTVLRLYLIYSVDPPKTLHIYQEHFLPGTVRSVLFGCIVLSYVAIINFKIERLGFENSRIRDEINAIKLDAAKKLLEQSEINFLTSLNALAKARDNETGNHIIRTQNYVKTLALRIRNDKNHVESLSDHHINMMFRAAPLHDIGKVGIPDRILLKNGSLTEEEWAVMKTHTLIGESILKAADDEINDDCNLFSIAIAIAGGHHEKWDGSGYPRGLSGESIPLEARIMALADMYDALVSKRIYKKAWTHEEARKEIMSKRSIHLDPLVVDAFIAEEDVFKEIAIKYDDG
ncbi:HD-GYP domain-containing protein [Polynucleobacter kasalickyi]|uniref:HD domain-containing protein n=1 Tax=Polynucleobacter kasalickyi TaxID=1938817 RepID=A0A1W1ZFI0_9BURK|nr:HD domain-containing phosphohydrolase [Polynucleobacter kasalickyi]SMC47147.1 HD domain-containing protein [Polynucleobacter kasalickyi]